MAYATKCYVKAAFIDVFGGSTLCATPHYPKNKTKNNNAKKNRDCELKEEKLGEILSSNGCETGPWLLLEIFLPDIWIYVNWPTHCEKKTWSNFQARQTPRTTCEILTRSPAYKELQMQAEAHPAYGCTGRSTYFQIIGKTLHLLNLSHTTVNSDIRGSSLSWPLCSWLFLQYLW